MLAWLRWLFVGECRHVWDTRFCGFEVKPDGTRRLEVARRCQLCLCSKREWLD